MHTTNTDVKEFQKKLRMQVAVWACAYEVFNRPLAPDSKFDDACKLIDVSTPTDRPDLDKWFIENFDEFTGMWVHGHPELDNLKTICERIFSHS